MKRFLGSLTLGVVLSGATTLLLSEGAHAQTGYTAPLKDVPRIINYQGTLTTADGPPVAGEYLVTVRLYSDAEGTQVIWEDTFIRDIRNGLVNLSLGSNKPLPATLALSGPVFIGVRIGSEAELRPLTALTASPYALNVADQSVTKEKLAVDYVGSIQINGQKITEKGSDVNFVAGDGLSMVYDPVGNAIRLSNTNNVGATKGTGALAVTTIAGDLKVNGNTDLGGTAANPTIKFTGKASSDLNMNSNSLTNVKELRLKSTGGSGLATVRYADNTNTSATFCFPTTGGTIATTTSLTDGSVDAAFKSLEVEGDLQVNDNDIYGVDELYSAMVSTNEIHTEGIYIRQGGGEFELIEAIQSAFSFYLEEISEILSSGIAPIAEFIYETVGDLQETDAAISAALEAETERAEAAESALATNVTALTTDISDLIARVSAVEATVSSHQSTLDGLGELSTLDMSDITIANWQVTGLGNLSTKNASELLISSSQISGLGSLATKNMSDILISSNQVKFLGELAALDTVGDSRVADNLTINLGNIEATPIGAEYPSSARFSTLTLSQDEVQVLETGGGINPILSYVRVAGSGGMVTGIDINEGETPGQTLVVEGTDDTNMVQLDADTIALPSGAVVLGQEDTASFIWNGSHWVLISYSDNNPVPPPAPEPEP